MQQCDFRHTILGNLFVTILLCVFAYQVVNNALFIHSHVLSDGTVTMHAHPYQKNTEQNNSRGAGHTHSKQTLWLLHMSYNMLFVFFAIAAFVFARLHKTFIAQETTNLYAIGNFSYFNNKSPPFL